MVDAFFPTYRRYKTVVFPAEHAGLILDGNVIDVVDNSCNYQLSIYDYRIIGAKLIAECAVLGNETEH